MPNPMTFPDPKYAMSYSYPVPHAQAEANLREEMVEMGLLSGYVEGDEED